MIHDFQNVTSSRRYDLLLSKCHSQWTLRFIIVKMSFRVDATIYYCQNVTPSGRYDSLFSKCHSQWTLPFIIVKMSLPVDATIHYFQNVTPSGRYDSLFSKCHSLWTLRFIIVKMSLPVDAAIHYCQNVTPSARYDLLLSKCHSQWTLRFKIVKMSLPVDATIHYCQNVTPSGCYDSRLSKCHSQRTLRFMIVKMSLPAGATTHYFQNVTPSGRYDSWLSKSLLTLRVLENFDLKQCICSYVYQTSITSEAARYHCGRNTAMMKCFQNLRAENWSKEKNLSELLANALLILNLQRTRTVSQVASGDGFVRLDSRLSKPLGTFFTCLCDAERFGRGSMWQSGMSCLIVRWKWEFLCCKAGSGFTSKSVWEQNLGFVTIWSNCRCS